MDLHLCGHPGTTPAAVLVPLVLYLALGERMLSPLSAARDWLERNNAAVMAGVLVVIGLQLILKGASDIA